MTVKILYGKWIAYLLRAVAIHSVACKAEGVEDEHQEGFAQVAGSVGNANQVAPRLLAHCRQGAQHVSVTDEGGLSCGPVWCHIIASGTNL